MKFSIDVSSLVGSAGQSSFNHASVVLVGTQRVKRLVDRKLQLAEPAKAEAWNYFLFSFNMSIVRPCDL